MTPATRLLKKQKITFKLHEYAHDKSSASYGLEAVEKMVVAILPVAEKLSMKLVAKIFGSKKAQMANKEDVLRSTGYVMGGVSPLGQKKRLNTVINSSAFVLETIFISAGKRGVEVQLNPLALQKLLSAKNEYICL